MPKPSIMARAKGYGRLADIERNEARELDWRPVPAFPEYEVNANRQVRRVTTKAYSAPYKYMLRPDDGEQVDFWISGQKHVVSLDQIMKLAWPKEETDG